MTARRATAALRRVATDPIRRLCLRPPLIARRWTPRPPDFVGVGVQRAGTSWWHALIEAHPDVHPLAPPGKELHFFDRFWAAPFGAGDVEAYHRCFLRPEGKRGGEWTPRYLYDPWTPPLLHRAAPGTRLLVLLRDPISRFRSGMVHRAERGWNIHDVAATGDAVSRGFYAAQLDHLLRSFPLEQLLVLQFEQCRTDPLSALRRTYAFLDLDEAPAVAVLAKSRIVNEGRSPAFELAPGAIESLREVYRADVARLAAWAPDLDLSLWPHFRDLA